MKRIALTLLLVLWTLFMFSCQTNTPQEKPLPSNEELMPTEQENFILYDESESAVIVCSENATTAEYQAAQNLQQAIMRVTGKEPLLTNDFDADEDNTNRKEILIGETNREESISARADIDEQELTIRVVGCKLVIAGSGPRITAYAVETFIETYLDNSAVETYASKRQLSLPMDHCEVISYYTALKLGKIVKYQLAENGTELRPSEEVVPVTVPKRDWEEGANYTGETVTIDRDSECLGGAQYVIKLFTEGLSRAPQSEEYCAYISYLEENGCNIDTLSALAFRIFTSEEFQEYDLEGKEMVFAVTRAILNRDPTAEELSEYAACSVETLVQKWTATDAFSSLLSEIIEGPYFWDGNNTSQYTGDTVITADELQQLLNSNQIVQLQPGTLILADKTITIPANVTLETEGNPTHYTKMARVIRVGDTKHNLIEMGSNAVLQNIYVEGNMSALPAGTLCSDWGMAGNIRMNGNGSSVIACRSSDPCGTFGVFVMSGTEFNYIGNSLVTCYASDHNTTWLDGIKCMGTDCLIEYNSVIDATDAAIAVFRCITGLTSDIVNAMTYIRAQNSIVRYNTIIQAGNSSYALLDFESNNIHWGEQYIEGTLLNVVENPANFTGFVMYENQIWTSMKAHTHVLIACSTQPWCQTGKTDRVFGGSVYNNFTPEGCSVNCAAGIAIDGNTDLSVRGNSFHLWIGKWCLETGNLRARIYSVDGTDSSGDLQGGYENLRISESKSTFIGSGYAIETAETYVIKEAILHESPRSIPVERFDSK